MAWGTIPGSGNLLMSSGDTLVTGVVSAQSVTANVASIGLAHVASRLAVQSGSNFLLGTETDVDSAAGIMLMAQSALIPTSGAMPAGQGGFYQQSGHLFWMGPLGTVTQVASA